MRYVVHESEGRFTLMGSHQPGLTVTVHDTLILCKTVGLFRTEGPGFARPASHQERRRIVKERARRLAERLNRENV